MLFFLHPVIGSPTPYREHTALGNSQTLEAPLIGNDLLLRTSRYRLLETLYYWGP